MKKIVAGAVLALASLAAHAESWFNFEGGIAVTSATKLGDDMYYQKGFSHDTPNGSYGFRTGVQMNVRDADGWIPGVRLHADYLNFGKVRWSSTDAEDPNSAGTSGYNVNTQSCNGGNCGTMRNFQSTGGIQAIALTVEPFWNIGHDMTFGIEAGPALFRSTWTSVATSLGDGNAAFGPAGTQQTFARNPRIQLGWIVGASISKGAFTLRYDYLRAPVDGVANGTLSGGGTGQGGGQWVPSGIKGEHMFSINYRY